MTMCKRAQNTEGLFPPRFYCLAKERVTVISTLDKECKWLEPVIPGLLLAQSYHNSNLIESDGDQFPGGRTENDFLVQIAR